MQTTRAIIAHHSLLADLPPAMQDLLVDLATPARFRADELIFHEGEEADRFYIMGPGQVSLEVYAPGRGRVVLQTLHEGDVLGWSWLFPPYRWHFAAHALEETQVLVIDGIGLRARCEADHELGYELMQRFAQIMRQRLHAARMQLLDLYGPQTM